jgi:hypothetical protein
VSGFQMVLAILFYTVNDRNPKECGFGMVNFGQSGPFENRKNLSGFQIVTSLNCFIIKTVTKRILFIIKWSRLAKIFCPVFKW